ncbi:MAG TPA: FixH family protein [Bacillota bacterium]|nr:FixH family protein [Bacillota bacterium]
MRKTLLTMTVTLLISLLVACGDDELHILEVDFVVPETAEVGETIELKAIVSYGDEAVTDADEVVFEVWEKNDRDNGEMIDAVNHEDGTYTTEVTFDYDGIFEMYAHTTAREMHTMPLKEIVVGEGGEYADDEEETVFHTEGFDMHFVELDDAKVDEDSELIVHLQINEEPLEDAKVRYEIWNDDMGDDREWVDASESSTGEYVGNYTFETAVTYYVQVHVEDDEDLHEHDVYEINVKQ